MKNKIKRKSIAEQIVSQIRKDIFTGNYKPGRNLPTERELAEHFGTSRGTLRRAMQTLSEEGWIETVQGRGNTVCDFRRTVSIDAVPDLLLDCPEAVLTPELLHFLVDFTSFLYEQILLAASEKAKPEDAPRLLELMYAQNESLTPAEFWNNEARYYGEILRVGNNVLLQMSFNLLLKIIAGMIESGIMKKPPYPIPIYREMHERMIAAVCSGDRRKVSELSRADKAHMIEFYRGFISDIADHSVKDGE